LRRLRAVAIAATFTTGLLTGTSNASSPADERAAALDKAIPAALQRTSIPGAIVGIWQDGREPYVRTFGVRDTATREKMATDLYMRIGSSSKTFTVTAILMLADQGKLDLDDPIDRYVEGVPGGDQITLSPQPSLARPAEGVVRRLDCGRPRAARRAPWMQGAFPGSRAGGNVVRIEFVRADGCALIIERPKVARPTFSQSAGAYDLPRQLRRSALLRPRLKPRQSRLLRIQYAAITAMKNDMRSAMHAMTAIMVA
jgi:hypothetical protein